MPSDQGFEPLFNVKQLENIERVADMQQTLAEVL